MKRRKRKPIGYILLVSVALNVIFLCVNISHKSGQATESGARVTAADPATPDPVIIEKRIEPLPPFYSVTSTERELLARVVNREAGGESLECQKAVVSVIFNRMNDGAWGETLNKVIYAKSQFAVVPLLSETTPDERNYIAVDYVIQNGGTVPEYVLFFRADYHFNWDGYIGYAEIDNTYFGYFEKDVK